ncbi:MAG: cytochrome c [Acidobacteria bacterium]|nr:cytochrome c [Acidobacteriota bacterium]
MSRTAWNVALLIAVAGLVGVNLTLRSAPAGRNIEIFPDMLESVPWDSFSANPQFTDGMTMRPRVEGTVQYGEPQFRFGKGVEEAVRAGSELVNPMVPDEATLARGEALFMTYCEVCHGPAGMGDGPISGRAGFPAPPSFVVPEAKSRAMRDGQIFHIATFGGENMVGYAAEIESEDRWRVVLWIRQLQQRSATSAGPTEVLQ